MRSSSSAFALVLLLICLIHGNEVVAESYTKLCHFTYVKASSLNGCTRRSCNDACQERFGQFVLGWCDWMVFCFCYKPCG
ncbi:unnamed protein product [Linum tenue]|uniref:Uncharacterized protein n=1 Tax=Linum tenue TaxID=586396 RepID=A0AAV0PEQ2_9ROSI|nr:unnamed protein product [Linum tenue]